MLRKFVGQTPRSARDGVPSGSVPHLQQRGQRLAGCDRPTRASAAVQGDRPTVGAGALSGKTSSIKVDNLRGGWLPPPAAVPSGPRAVALVHRQGGRFRSGAVDGKRNRHRACGDAGGDEDIYLVEARQTGGESAELDRRRLAADGYLRGRLRGG